MSVNGSSPTLGQIADQSPWIAGSAGLAAAVKQLDRDLDHERTTIAAHAARVARPGLVPPVRAARHVAALQLAQLRRLADVPRELTRDWLPLRTPATWAKQSVASMLRDQLALLGPAAAEVGRIIDHSEGLAPGVIVEELRRRPLLAEPIRTVTAERIARRSLTDDVELEPGPLSGTPLSQLHRGTVGGRPALVRVRRPGVRRDVIADARITATLVAPLEWALPTLGEAHPLGFVELLTRQLLEESDLRNDALNAIELGLAAEEMAIPGLSVARPLPAMISERTVAYEDIGSPRPVVDDVASFDVDVVIAAAAAITIESALRHGCFHADLRVENLLVGADGELVIVGCGTLGRLDVATRRSALEYLTAVLSGDFDGQINAMRLAGAVPDHVDVDALRRDLEANEALDPMLILGGGEASLVTALREAVTLLVRHRLRPPLEVVMFVRSVFALRALIHRIDPERSLMAALFPLLQRLPDLRASLDDR